MINKSWYTKNRDNWATPQAFFAELDAEFHFNLDPCATPETSKCEKFFTWEDNGLIQHWDGNVFVNPPYGRGLANWFMKAIDEIHLGNAKVVVFLVPARTDTAWFHDQVLGKAELRFIRGRLKYDDIKQSAPFPSMLVIYRPDLSLKTPTPGVLQVNTGLTPGVHQELSRDC